MKPIDIQTNILQMNNAAKEISKQKGADLNNQNYAAALIEKNSVEKGNKIVEADKVESALHVLENEVKDNRSRNQGGKKEQNKKSKEEKEESQELFVDPNKGFMIDIKE